MTQHERKNVFRTRIKVVKWGENEAELIEFGGHYYHKDENYIASDTVFETEGEEQQFSAMAAALMKAGTLEGG